MRPLWKPWSRIWEAGRPWVIAHRGDSAHAPENTLEAARRAFAAGADAWELDVQLTRDGIPIVLHDATLQRTTNVAARYGADLPAAALTWDEIQHLDAGSWFVRPDGGPRTAAAYGTFDQLDSAERDRFRSGTVRVPSLAEALRLTVALDWCVNIELKPAPGRRKPLLDAVLHSLDETAAWEHAWISSFDHALLAELRTRRPDAIIGVLTLYPLHRPERYVREHLGGDALHPATEAVAASPETDAPLFAQWADLAAAAVPVFVFTVNDAQPGGRADQLRQAGAWGVFTDDPQALRQHWR